MSILSRTGILWLLLACLAASARGATYYVDDDGSNGNDGSSAHPWQTLQYAADRVAAGDTVVVRAGTYAGFVTGWDSALSGTAGNPVTFRAEAGVTITGRNARTADAINLEGSSYMVIDGFAILNPSGNITRAGVRSVENHHVTIRNCRIDGMGRWGILTGHTDDALIENNHCSNSQAENGIYVSNACVRPVVRGNTLHHNNANGLHMNGDESMGGNGIITGALVEKNIIYENGAAGGSGINGDGLRDSVIRNNLLYSNHASGISLYRIDAAQSAANNVIVNNTVVMAANGRWCLNIVNGSTGNVVFNNILWHAGTRGSINIAADSLTGFKSDYNVVKDLFSANDGDSFLTLAQWRTATGQDAHSRIATPAEVFVDSGANDYHLKEGSSAVDAGTASLSARNAPAEDLEGYLRPSGSGYDAGAYERHSGSPPVISSHSPATPLAMLAGTTQAFSVEAWDADGDTLSYVWTLDDEAVPVTVDTMTYSPLAADAGAHIMVVTVSDGHGGTAGQTWSVTVVLPGAPVIALSAAALAPGCTQGKDAAAQSFTVRNSGTGLLSYTISTGGAAWLSCTPSSGTSTGEPDTIAVSYSTAGLAAGTYPATVTVTAPDAGNSPMDIPVTLTVSNSGGGGGGGGGGCTLAPGAAGTGGPLGGALPYLAFGAVWSLARIRSRRARLLPKEAPPLIHR
jgi:hypothetical protein